MGDVTRWQFGAIGDPFGALTPEVVELPSPQKDAVPQETLEEALADAFAQGEAKGQADTTLLWQQKLDDYVAGEGAKAAERLHTLEQNFAQGLMQAQKSMAQNVLALACEVARQIVRRELQADPQVFLAVVDEALGELTSESLPTLVRLHPDDEAMWGAALRTQAGDRAVQWIADSEVVVGGCHVEQNGKLIDASLQTRWQRALAPVGMDMPWQAGEQHGT